MRYACGQRKDGKNDRKCPTHPTQDTKTLSLKCILGKGSKHIKTLMGLVKRIMAKLMINPGRIMGTNSRGLTNKPKVRNINNWLSQAKASKKFNVDRLWTNREFPITSPLI